MASPKKKATTTLRRPSSGRAYSGFGGVGLDDLYRLATLAFPFSAGRWASAGSPGGSAGGGWGGSPGGSAGGGMQDWGAGFAAPSFAASSMGGISAAPSRGLAPERGVAPIVGSVPAVPVRTGPAPVATRPERGPAGPAPVPTRLTPPPAATPTPKPTLAPPTPTPGTKPGSVMVGVTKVPTALANLLGAASAAQVKIATAPKAGTLPTRITKGQL
jgi:hypothetical protein